jgi:hypothetical protein
MYVPTCLQSIVARDACEGDMACRFCGDWPQAPPSPDFFAMHGYFAGGADAQLRPVAPHPDNGDRQIASRHDDLFSSSATQDQHDGNFRRNRRPPAIELRVLLRRRIISEKGSRDS